MTMTQITTLLKRELKAREKDLDEEWDTKGHTNRFERLQCQTSLLRSLVAQSEVKELLPPCR